MKNFLGAIGGMGPLATSNFLSNLVVHTATQTDQENTPVIVCGDCTTLDQTKNIVGDEPSPYAQLLQAATFLNDAGFVDPSEVLAISVTKFHAKSGSINDPR
jgi:aspartate racemase